MGLRAFAHPTRLWLRAGGADRRLLIVVGVPADDFPRPDELLARRKNLAHGGEDDPPGDASGDEGIEDS